MLLTTAQKLQVVLAGAITTSQLQVQTSYVDFPSANPGGFGVLTNSTTDVDIVAAPSVGLRRVVELTVYNADTVNATVSIKVDEGGTDKIKVKVLLNPGQSLSYGSDGWQVVTATQQGGNYASFRANKNTTDQTGITDSADVKITFTNEVWDTGSYYDAANSKWTPPAGPVIVGGMIYLSGGVVINGTYNIKVFKNGTMIAASFLVAYATSAGVSVTVSIEDLANGTDYYEIYTFSTGGGTKTVSGLTAYSQFWGSMT